MVEIPSWLKSYIKSEEAQHLETVVHDAEKITSAEIRPVVVRSSSQYYQVAMTLRLIGLLIFVIFWQLEGWNLYWDAFEESLLHVVVGLVFALYLLPQLARWDLVKRWMTYQKEEEEQAINRAQIEFYLNHMDKTDTGHGILIFISLLEHQVVVLADKTIAEKLPRDTWKDVVDQIVQGLRQKKLALGLEAGIKQCSLVLAPHFPIQSNDRNEIPNTLIIKE